MSLATFLENPWSSSHESYGSSALNIRPAPEFATAEVVVASTYRASGFADYAEKSVPAAGRKFDKEIAKAASAGDGTHVSSETWKTILHGALESPKQPNQSARRFLQMAPIVPDVALYSGSARLSGNSWNPGQLVMRVIRLGCLSVDEAQEVWRELHNALSVGEDDDVWAKWLQHEFMSRRQPDVKWARTKFSEPTLADEDKVGIRLPAVQFVKDLTAVVGAKSRMTRRQWVSLLEAVLRLGTVAHVLWLCDANDRLWQLTREVLNGAPVPTDADVRRRVIHSNAAHLSHGAPALPIVRDLASRYLAARLGINLVLWHLGEAGLEVETLSSAAGVVSFLDRVSQQRDALMDAGVLAELARLRDSQARTIACKKGIGSNIAEFCRYALGQRQTADPNLRGYDQGYQLRKKAEYSSAPWVVSLGPVAVLALVHCCLAEAAGPRSIQRLSEHLAWYGLGVDVDDIAKSDLGKTLRMLGLVLDSPDAESGMLLIPPFDIERTNTKGQAE